MSLLDQYLESEIIFRLRQEGYILLLLLLFVFTFSILASNILAQLFTWCIQVWSYVETAELRPLRKKKSFVLQTEKNKGKA